LIRALTFASLLTLRSLGHDVSAVSRNYPPGLADDDVLAIALSEQRILVVADRDFGELIFHQGALLMPGFCSSGFRVPSCKTKVEHLD
jgi:hypothetical protein